MKSLAIQFVILIVITTLITYFLNKDYKINWKAKKVFTYSKYGRIALILGCISTPFYLAIMSFFYENLFSKYFCVSFNIFIEWVVIPILCIFFILSTFYATYTQFMFRQKHNIKR